MDSDEFRGKAIATQDSYAYLKQYVSSSLRVSAIDGRTMGALLKAFKDRPGLYLRVRSAILRVCKFAQESGWRDDCPRHITSRGKIGAIQRWSSGQVVAAIEKIAADNPALAGQQARTLEEIRASIALVYFTAQRLVDVVKLRPCDVRPSVEFIDGESVTLQRFLIVQQKTGAEVFPEVTAELLAQLPEREPLKRYISMSAPAVRQAWRRVRAKLGLEYMGLTLHGPRKSASCEAAEGGASVPELQAYLGHRSVQTSALYFAQANKAKLASSAMRARKRVA